MAEQRILTHLPFIRILPDWAQELSYKYCSNTANLFIVHGNIRDYLPHKTNENEFIFVKIQNYISEVLFGNRDIIIYYDRSCTNHRSLSYIDSIKQYTLCTNPNIISDGDALLA